MKTIVLAVAILIPIATSAQIASAPAGYPIVLTPYHVAAAGPHDQVWQSVTIDAPGVTNVHTYTEVATGLNWNPAAGSPGISAGSGGWQPALEEFFITAEGYAVATNGQHKLIVGPDISASGAIDFLGPDGVRLTGNPMGLAFSDSASGQVAPIAGVTNCQGELTAPNVVTFPQAFNMLKAAINYTYKRGGIEQDVVLYQQLPDPESYGLNASTTALEMWTEFLESPQPAITASGLTADQTLDFGQTRMGQGYAYLLNGSGLEPIPLQKTWTNILNRTFLIEAIPYQTLKPLLDTLQASAGRPSKTQIAGLAFPSRSALVAKGFAPRRKPLQTASIRPGRRSSEPALLLDYQTLNTSQTNYIFAADTTYYISSSVTLSGSPAFEGGAVLKLSPTNSAGLYLPGTNVWAGQAYRPTVITARDDDNCGEVIAGSTSNPNTNYYGSYALEFNTASAPAYLRILYATEAIRPVEYNANISLSHAQIENCKYVFDNEGDDGVTFTLHNVLLYSNLNFSQGSIQSDFYGEQVTVHLVTNYAAGDTIKLTNSLFAATSGFSGGNSNAFIASDSGIFQMVGAGMHYLSDNSPYRQAGATNLAANTLAYLSQRTTYPPVILGAIVTNTTLWPQAPRDCGLPDLGYLYDPLDYCLNAVTLTNTLVLTNGVALGMYGSYGIDLRSGADLISQGTPTALNRLVRYQSVQEVSTNWGGAGSTVSLLNLSSTYSALPQVFLRFTDLSFLANPYYKRYILYNDASLALSSLALRDCSVCGGALDVFLEGGQGPPTMTVALTNNLILRPYFYLAEDCSSPDLLIVQAWNNLFQWGTVTLYNEAGTTTWYAYDNLFDRVGALTNSANCVQNGHNGYVTNYNGTNFGILPASKGSDKYLTNTPAYQTSWLGSFYYPTNDGQLSTLIGAGSCSATNLGLYHYTTTTNQVIDGTNTVTIGFHYVATTNGIPLCRPGDGIPDYLADSNGDGIYDTGDYCNWQQYYSLNGLAGTNGLQVFTPLK